MSVSVEEQETTISFYRDSDTAVVYTSDRTVMTKLDKLAEDPGSPWTLVRESRLQGGDVVGKYYRTPKGLISFRRAKVTRELTDEQKADMAQRLRNSLADWKNKA